MKTMLALSLAALAAIPVVRAADAAVPPCCANCAAGEEAATPLTARSIYQAEGKWTDDRGEAFSLATLRGRPVVLAMFFANCSYACPMLVSDMQRLRAALPADVRAKARFVLVSFDVARDTPAALAAYRARMGLEADTWTLLHGDAGTVQELAMLLGVKYKQDAQGQFSHSNLITVLNREGEIAHQRAGLAGDVSIAAQALVLASK
jgi:protein SCO1/2